MHLRSNFEKTTRLQMSDKGIEVDFDKIKAIQNLLATHTLKEVKRFLGRLNYIFRFISHLTDKCDSIFKLILKHDFEKWDEEC